MLGVDSSRLRHLQQLGLQIEVLPSTDSWLPDASDQVVEDNEDEYPSEQQVLQDILERECDRTLARCREAILCKCYKRLWYNNVMILHLSTSSYLYIWVLL